MKKQSERGSSEVFSVLMMLPIIAIMIILLTHPEAIMNIAGAAFGTGGSGSDSTSHCIVNVTTNTCSK